MEEAYRQARKRGEQGRRRAISQSEHPYLTDLDSLVAQLPLGQRENVGLRDIPLEMVVGTVTKGRQSAFSCNFMPLLPFSTEFARKWSNLYDIQVTEGYRDPVIVTEFMHRFYVQEGNKRVSVLKFLEAPTVSAQRLPVSTPAHGIPSKAAYTVSSARFGASAPYTRSSSRVRGAMRRSPRCSVRTLSKNGRRKRSTTCATPSCSLSAPTFARAATTWTLRLPTHARLPQCVQPGPSAGYADGYRRKPPVQDLARAGHRRQK